MTDLRVWVAGARPRTLGAALSPVMVGTAVAARYGDVVAWRAAMALLVAVSLQVGVNYANDYSDGVRGVDRDRKGPVRLTASGLASPKAVKMAAISAMAVGGLAGLVLAVAVDWRLALVGAASVLAAALYSGGPKPYASAGMGEVMVFVFFGLVATCGSAYVQLERLPWMAVVAAVPVGFLACAILLVNNLRDVESDAASGKRTLAVRVGADRALALYRGALVGGVLLPVVLVPAAPGALLALVGAPLAIPPLRAAKVGAPPPVLVGALVATATVQLVVCTLLAIGLAL